MKKTIFIILGTVCLGLGTIGVFLPILPTVPFYLATVFFFSQSSDRLHRWFYRQIFIKNIWNLMWKKEAC